MKWFLQEVQWASCVCGKVTLTYTQMSPKKHLKFIFTLLHRSHLWRHRVFQHFLLISNMHRTFIRTWIISRHSFERENISDFFLFTFLFHEWLLWDWNQYFFRAKYSLSKFPKGLLQYSPFFLTKGEKTWSLVVVVMSAILQRCQDWMNEIYNYNLQP